jgi:hypothetical protein
MSGHPTARRPPKPASRPATDVAATIVAGSHADNVDLVMVADRRGLRWSQTGPNFMGGRPSERGCFMTATRSTQ